MGKWNKFKEVIGIVHKVSDKASEVGVPYAGIVKAGTGLALRVKDKHGNPEEPTSDEQLLEADLEVVEALSSQSERLFRVEQQCLKQQRQIDLLLARAGLK